MGVLDGKIAIITGAGANMGEAAAVLFAAEGARVVCADWDADTGSEVAHRIGGQFIRADVSSSADVDALVDATVERYGRVDIMYNNAGIARVSRVLDTSDADFAAIMGVNMGGVFHGTRAAGAAMKRQGGGGAIINTASTAAIQHVEGMALYSASKAAVVAFTKVAAAELAPFGIRVNAILPGTIPSRSLARQMGLTDADIAAMDDKQPIGRVGRPEEVARGALYLATEQSSFVVGHALVIDGGMTTIGALKV